MDYKNMFIIILAVLIVGLFYLIFTGSFCHCSPVRCPNSCPDPMRSYLT